MSVTTETYGCGRKFKVEVYFGITDMTSKQLEAVKEIVEVAFKKAEDEVEKQLYKTGLMTCNGMLCDIAEMRELGNYLVQAHIQELDEKYKEE